jgi:hypothetical protein
MDLLIRKFSPTSYYVGPHTPMSSPFSNTLSRCYALNIKRPSFTLKQNYRQNYSFVYFNFDVSG